MFYHACFFILENNKIIFVGNRKGNVYENKIDTYMKIENCLISIDILSKLVKNELVKGFPHIAFKKEKLYDACQMSKLMKTSFKSNNHILAKKPLELLLIDLFGPTKNRSLSGNRYVFCDCWWFYKI